MAGVSGPIEGPNKETISPGDTAVPQKLAAFVTQRGPGGRGVLMLTRSRIAVSLGRCKLPEAGAFDSGYSGGFAGKLSADGSQLLYSTHLGGTWLRDAELA